jgi:hypothetical protein
MSANPGIRAVSCTQLTSSFWAAATAAAVPALPLSASTLSNVPNGSATEAGTAICAGSEPRISCGTTSTTISKYGGRKACK